jgi:hypothetical protein
MRQWPKAKGRRHVPGEMNKAEAAWAHVLEAQKRSGEIVDYWFESCTVKLGPDCRYTADFLVMCADGTLELHEVKGGKRDKAGKVTPYIEGDALVKLKAAADKFPFPLRLVYRYRNDPWIEREI